MPTILVTGFRPFDNRSVNGAETLARSLHGAKIGEARVETRLLNVVWRDVDRFARRVLPNTSATFVLGIGEADRPWPTFETLGRPVCDGLDVLGNSNPDGLSGQSARQSQLGFGLDWFDDSDAAPRESDDAGAYLCNYLLMKGLEHSTVPFGFLHVPVQGDRSNADFVKRYQPVVRALLTHNLTLIT